jgi:hypothetical protein
MGKWSLLMVCMLLSFSVWSQQKAIRGKVADANGVPLSGVTVAARGTDNATQTNVNGDFQLMLL